MLLYNPEGCRGEKKVCPFFLLENSRPLFPWAPLDLSTCLGNLSLKGIFPTQGSNPGLPHCRHAPPGKPRNTGVGSPVPSPGDLPSPGIKPGSPPLQVDSLPTELPGKAFVLPMWKLKESLSALTKASVIFSVKGYLQDLHPDHLTSELVSFKNIFNWNVVALQSCVSVSYTAK